MNMRSEPSVQNTQPFIRNESAFPRLDKNPSHSLESRCAPSPSVRRPVDVTAKSDCAAGYFGELLATNPEINEGLATRLRLCCETVVRLQKTESALIRSLECDPLLSNRVERLVSIPAIGPITALTWALEVGEVHRWY